MTRKQKLLEKAQDNPYSLTYSELKILLKTAGWKFRKQTGSHEIWTSPRGAIISIQNMKGKAKGYQVKQFIEQCKDEGIYD